MSFAGKKKLQEIHEGRPEVFPRVSKPHTTSLLITQHAMQNSECFAATKTKRKLKSFFSSSMYSSSLTILVINAIQIIRNMRPMQAYVHMIVTNSKAFGYFGHCAPLNIVSIS